MSDYILDDERLECDGLTILDGLDDCFEVLPDASDDGVFLRAHADRSSARHQLLLGRVPGLRRFSACYRSSAYWMEPAVGNGVAGIPVETQFLLVEFQGPRYGVLMPLIGTWFRASLEGRDDDELFLVSETGDYSTVGRHMTALYVAVGEDPYALVHAAARTITEAMKSGRLREQKPLPAMIDYFGWCTWDAFYREVTSDKVLAGLESFAEGRVQPRFLIIDDGWLSMRTMESGEERLTSFAPNDKFPEGLLELTREAKSQYALRYFLVWHTIHGYWGGVDHESMPEYQVLERRRDFSPGVRRQSPDENKGWGGRVGLVAASDMVRFYNDFHRYLMTQGVDGVKVDSQCVLEGVGEGQGGRVELMRSCREALEGSVHTHFLGTVINCMSCSNDMIYNTLNSNLTRSSIDFWPQDPKTHGRHVFINAQTSYWMGEFVHPDWDMFQSDHAAGAFHAASRAVSGGPVYVSDRPDGHDFDLLRKLVLSDGSILRATLPARPTRDCLFIDPTTDGKLLKVFNLNLFGGVVGAFNCRYSGDGEQPPAIAGELLAADVEGLFGDRFAIWAHRAERLYLTECDEALPVSLGDLEFEIFTVMPVANDFAPIGLADKFNSGAAVADIHWHGDNSCHVHLRDGGQFVAWSAREPARVSANQAASDFSYDPASGAISVAVDGRGPAVVELHFD